MRNSIAALAVAFVQLTAPDGTPIYFNPALAVGVTSWVIGCERIANSRVVTLNGTYCIKETPADAADKLKVQ